MGGPTPIPRAVVEEADTCRLLAEAQNWQRLAKNCVCLTTLVAVGRRPYLPLYGCSAAGGCCIKAARRQLADTGGAPLSRTRPKTLPPPLPASTSDAYATLAASAHSSMRSALRVIGFPDEVDLLFDPPSLIYSPHKVDEGQQCVPLGVVHPAQAVHGDVLLGCAGLFNAGRTRARSTVTYRTS